MAFMCSPTDEELGMVDLPKSVACGVENETSLSLFSRESSRTPRALGIPFDEDGVHEERR